MKREKLRRVLAVALLDILSLHALTVPNVKRYVTSHLLFSYGIRSNTEISDDDRSQALLIACEAVRGKPTSFRTAPRGSPLANERRSLILAGRLQPV